jgi:hypothetical protein
VRPIQAASFLVRTMMETAATLLTAANQGQWTM